MGRRHGTSWKGRWVLVEVSAVSSPPRIPLSFHHLFFPPYLSSLVDQHRFERLAYSLHLPPLSLFTSACISSLFFFPGFGTKPGDGVTAKWPEVSL